MADLIEQTADKLVLRKLIPASRRSIEPAGMKGPLAKETEVYRCRPFDLTPEGRGDWNAKLSYE
jgi:hypothetical protein